MKKIILVFIVPGLFLTACMETRSPSLVSTNTPTLALTDTPIVPTSTLIFTPTLTATIIPTSTITIPRSLKNKQYWAIVSRDRSAFWFMINPKITEWTWYKAPEMSIEYEWGVEFPISENPYPIYSAEVILGPDKKGLIPQKGTINELLAQCESGLWLMDRGGMLNLNMDKAVEAKYFNGGLLIELTDIDKIAKLYQAHPKTLLFKTYSRSNLLPNRKVDVTISYQ